MDEERALLIVLMIYEQILQQMELKMVNQMEVTMAEKREHLLKVVIVTEKEHQIVEKIEFEKVLKKEYQMVNIIEEERE